ncbi:ankyrin repeat domain-containing protein [Gordonia sp. DT30]|uniref:ankyrin repeat domain-containing protein n=1 Tax=unclassified Gordonia (in: high G+C Gram-positive bacteria) TaxID=2657482 RepID=UPI003CF43960
MTSDPGEIDPEVIALATRLFGLARAGTTAELAAYLDAGVPADLRNQAGDSLLMLAAYHGHADTVAALLARGADADLANDRGQSPLAGAVFKGHDDVVTVLLGAGADPHHGAPTAHDTALMFGRADYLARWGDPADEH